MANSANKIEKLMNFEKSSLVEKIFPAYFSDVADVQSSEATYASLLYYHLMSNGYSHKQICTEMYSANLVPDGRRPDLVVFNSGIDGRFNYYRDCDKKQDNTPTKIEHIGCVVEIKGGAQQTGSGLTKYDRDDPLGLNLLDDPEKRKKAQNCALAIDIEKLGMWAQQFGRRATYVFLAIDIKNPKGFWPTSVRKAFGQYCEQYGVLLVYYAQGASYFFTFEDGQERAFKVRQ